MGNESVSPYVHICIFIRGSSSIIRYGHCQAVNSYLKVPASKGHSYAYTRIVGVHSAPPLTDKSGRTSAGKPPQHRKHRR